MDRNPDPMSAQRSDDSAPLPRSTFDTVMREALEVRAHEIPAELAGAQVTPVSENGATAVYAVTLNGGEPIEVTISERDGQHYCEVPGRKPSHGYVSREHALAGAIRKMRREG